MVRCPKETIRAPTPPPIIQRVVERAPTPEADVFERIIIRPQPQQLIERIIERPRTPPPRIIEKEICEAAPPPIVRTRIVKVDHSPRHYANNQGRVLVQPSKNCGYVPCPPDYDHDRSFSASYSTSDLYANTMHSSGYGGGGGYGGGMPSGGMFPQQSMNLMPQQQQPQQASYSHYSPYGAASSGYNNYGYKGAPPQQQTQQSMVGYNQPQQMQQGGYANNNQYPKPY